MLAIGYSAAVRGVDAYIVQVEVVGIATADPTIHIVGLPDRAIQESRERVNAAVRACGFLFPTYKVVVNLAPADVRKEGAAFDVALALAILAMDQQLAEGCLRDFVCMGELALDGAIRPVGGVLPIAMSAVRSGFRKLILPTGNVPEAKLVDGLTLYPVRTLHEAVQAVLGLRSVTIRSGGATNPSGSEREFTDDLASVRGQLQPRRALKSLPPAGTTYLW